MGIRVRLWIVLSIVMIVCAISCSKKSSDIDDYIDTDNISPATITDLETVSVTTNSVLLQWTAPGDDGSEGFAYEYDLRGSLDSITAENFPTAYRIDSVDAPLPAGYTQEFMVEELTQGQQYFFAIKSRDDAGNWSGLSNCASATCLADIVVTFPDTALDSLIRETINLPSGDIHMSDLQDMTDLIGEARGIENISGLEYCISLHWLILQSNNISDISPLESLTSLLNVNIIANNISDITPLAGSSYLQQLHLGENPVSDISVLAALDNLEWIRLNSTQVQDLSPLYDLPALQELDVAHDQLSDISFISNFTQVKTLRLSSNSISDITPLGGLTQLENLDLFGNQISDISALEGLINIISINLTLNQVSDISPLVDNSGLGSGDVVNLLNNPLSQQSINEYIPILEQRGVTVYY